MPKSLEDMLIRVREQAHRAILDSETATADAEKHLKPWLEVIRDLANYGTNLIVRCVHSSGRKTKDRVVLTILLRQAVAMLDGIEVLLSRGCTHAANLQMRALFEAAVYINWILAGDSERKARYYHVHNLRRKRLWASRTQPGSPESAAFAAEMGKYQLPVTDELKTKSKEQAQEIDRILADPELAGIDKDFETAKTSRRLKRDVAWYVPLGPRNFAEIARATNQRALYAILYSGASEVMHSSSDDQHVAFEGGKLTIKSIRSFAGFELIFQFSVGIILDLYGTILGEYRPGERPAFSRKYIAEWRKYYMTELKIKYETSQVITI